MLMSFQRQTKTFLDLHGETKLPSMLSVFGSLDELFVNRLLRRWIPKTSESTQSRTLACFLVAPAASFMSLTNSG
jgi:hypothetical protein